MTARFLYRRQFLPRLARIVGDAVLRRDTRDAAFVSLMGGLGDLVNAFPTLDRLSQRGSVDLGTGGGAYRALAEANPHLRRVYAPFVYKPIRRAHRRLIEATLRPFYRSVVLLDEADSRWRTRGRHMAEVYAERCGCPPPKRGAVHVPDAARRAAASFLGEHGLDRFVFVVQLIRRRRPERSWPLAHYQTLYRELRKRLPLPVLVHTVGSDETAVPKGCVPLASADILTAAALIERATLFVGPDTGLTHVAAALGVPTLAIHLGHPPEVCAALGDNVVLVRQAGPYADPALTTPEQVLAKLDHHLAVKA